MDPAGNSLQQYILNVPQIVPGSWCSECRICCRFPATENVQTPFWSALEAGWAKPKMGQAPFVEDPNSPSLAPKLVSCGESGYRCPAFVPEANNCSIHAVKPLDCRLYPFVLAHNSAQNEVLLAMDPKCPFIEAHRDDPEVSAYAVRLTEYLDTPDGMEYLKRNPRVVGPAWPEYLWVSALPRATGWLQKAAESRPPHPLLRPVRDQDLPLLIDRLRARPRRLSQYTLASLLGWSDLVRLWWLPLKQGLALFFEQSSGLFMPVPPLGDFNDEASLRQAWGILAETNQGNGVSRIEGVEVSDRGWFEGLGFKLKPAEKEYVYAVGALAKLAGDDYKTQRWAVNRASRELSFRVRPFEDRDLVPCLQLYTRWAVRRQAMGCGEEERIMLRDSVFFHRRLMMDRDLLGLWGRVLESNEKVLAYTFGAVVSAETFCVLAEIAERDVPGLAQVLFKEFCAEIESKGYRWVNTMGDAGSESLRRAKLSYRPEEEIEAFTALRDEGKKD